MQFEESIVIKRPPETVWAFWSDPFNIPRLRGASLAYSLTSPGPRVVRTFDVELHPALRLLTPVLRPVLRRQQQKVLHNLKQSLEAAPV